MSEQSPANAPDEKEAKPTGPAKKESLKTELKREMLGKAFSTEVMVAFVGCLGTVITAFLGGIFLLASQDKLHLFSSAEVATATQTAVTFTVTAPVITAIPPTSQPNTIQDVFSLLASQGEEIKGAAFTEDGGWAVWHGQNGVWWNDSIPTATQTKIQELTDAGQEIKQIAFVPTGGWVILYGKSDATWIDLPAEAETKIQDLYQAGADLRQIAFTPTSGWVIIYDNNQVAYVNIPDSVVGELDALKNAGKSIIQLAFSPQGGAVIVYQGGVWVDHISDALDQEITHLLNAGETIQGVVFHPQGGWIVLYGKNSVKLQDIPEQ